LLHPVLILPGGRLRRLVGLAPDPLSGQEQPLLQLLTHGIGELVLQPVEDGLDGLADLLLERLPEGLPCRGGLFLLAARTGCAVVRARPSRSRRPSGPCFVV
jgi:hypothetical protein